MSQNLDCRDIHRRNAVRGARQIYGLDYVEPAHDPRELRAFFLGRAPQGLGLRNIRIEGGRRIRDVRAIFVELIRPDDPEKDDVLKVIVNHEGDHSVYTLSLVDPDHEDGPQPLPSMDKRYWRVEFTFRPDAPGDLDCKTACSCPTDVPLTTGINYLAKDYNTFRQVIIDRLSQSMPNWSETHAPDVMIMLAEVLAYTADYLSYYQDAVSTEAYLSTARKRISVRRHARLVDYRIHEGCGARTWICLEGQDCTIDLNTVSFITQFDNQPDGASVIIAETNLPQLASAGSYEVFEAVDRSKIQVYAAHNRIGFYTWGDTVCCLPKGSTRATLVGHLAETEGTAEKALRIKAGVVLIFEEVLGPDTGAASDADPTHRQAVRLTRVTANHDPLFQVDVVDIEWDPQDALTFPLCISSVLPPPDCRLLTCVSVVRANVVMVGHGQAQSAQWLGQVQTKQTPLPCDSDCPGDLTLTPQPFTAILGAAPLSYSQPPDRLLPASRQLLQDPRAAQPQIDLVSTPVAGSTTPPSTQTTSTTAWNAKFDLLESGPGNTDYVVEVDDNGYGNLRFGGNGLGRMPTAGDNFWALSYRVGVGSVGNVGADSIVHLLLDTGASTPPITAVTNPLPAIGGLDPESISDVQLLAPTAFQTVLDRAITPEDYATLAEQCRGVQKAAARLRWTGAWYEVRVAIDALGTDQPTPAFLNHVREHLHRYRRIGHDLEVVAATYVPIAVGIDVRVLPGYLNAHVRAVLLQTLGTGTLPDGTLGFFNPDNLTFGQSIYASQLLAAVQTVDGVAHAQVTELRRLDSPVKSPAPQMLSIGKLEIAQMDNDPDFPGRGRLWLKVGGGI
jgi:hypothetical protein